MLVINKDAYLPCNIIISCELNFKTDQFVEIHLDKTAKDLNLIKLRFRRHIIGHRFTVVRTA